MGSGCTNAKELHVGPVDAALNSTDLGTKFHPRLRFEELPNCAPSEKQRRLDDESRRREHSTVRGNGDAREEVPAFDFMLKLFAGLLVLLVTVFFFFVFFCLHTRGCVKGSGQHVYDQECAGPASAG